MRLPGMGSRWKEPLVGLWHEISKDHITDFAASVTYYSVLALFPFLLFVVALAGLFMDLSNAEELVAQLSKVAPGAVTQIVGDRLRELATSQNVTLVGFGALAAIWAASNAVRALMRALNVANDVEERRPFWKTNAISLLMTVAFGGLALAAGLIAIAAGPLADWIGGSVGTAIGLLRLPVAGLVMMIVWALVYYVLPDVEREFKFITPGSVGSVVVWVLASWGFSIYVANFGRYDKVYGSLGGVIVLLLWMWISSLIVLVGAEVNAFIEQRSPEGEREGAKRGPRAGTDLASSLERGHEDRAQGMASGAASERGTLRGFAAVATGFAAGLLLSRRRKARQRPVTAPAVQAPRHAEQG